MARVEIDRELVPSVLDRLIDNDPDISIDTATHRGMRLSELKEAVKKDLEWLLNSRQSPLELSGASARLRESLLTFGLPDFTHASLHRPQDQLELKSAIEQAIRHFEPRLRDVVIKLVRPGEFDRGLRFRIDANLIVEPKPEPIVFDSELELSTKSFIVRAD
jgi:type VI secretion system protein ImpF